MFRANLSYLVGASFALALNASAAPVISYDNAANVGHTQNWQGLLGLDFTVNKSIIISALGVFDNGSAANLAGVNPSYGVTVGIFNLTTGQLMGNSAHFSATFGDTGTQINGDTFKPVSISLTPGQYSVVTTNDTNYNSSGGANATVTLNTNGGDISFDGEARYSAATSPPPVLSVPNIVDGGPAYRYDSGTFQFDTAPTLVLTTEDDLPEPGTMGLIASGILALAAFRRKRALTPPTVPG